MRPHRYVLYSFFDLSCDCLATRSLLVMAAPAGAAPAPAARFVDLRRLVFAKTTPQDHRRQKKYCNQFVNDLCVSRPRTLISQGTRTDQSLKWNCLFHSFFVAHFVNAYVEHICKCIFVDAPFGARGRVTQRTFTNRLQYSFAYSLGFPGP